MILIAAMLALSPAPATAELCSAIRQVPGGKFTYTFEQGYSIATETARPGLFVNDRGTDVVGFVCMRDDPFPVLDDVEVIKAGFVLYIGGRTGDRLVGIELADGRVRSRILNGELSTGEQKRLDQLVEAMQARIDAARS